MTPDERLIVARLAEVKRAAGFDTTFVNDMLTFCGNCSPKQSEFIYRLLYKYRDRLPFTYKQYKSHEFCRQKRTARPKKNIKGWEKLF